MPWLDDTDLRDARRLDRSLRDEHTVGEVRRAALTALARMVPADEMSWQRRPAARRPSTRYGLTIELPARSPDTVVIGLGRTEQPFSVRDRELLGLVSPAIGRELRAAEARALAADPPPGCAVLLLDSHGEIVQSSLDAERWLAEHFGPGHHPGWLPEPITDWLALPPRPPLVSLRDGRLLMVRLLPARPPDPHVLLLQERLDAFRGDALRALGLTPRECEVLEVARTVDNAGQIADALFLSRHAVHERMERVEAKLGVHTGSEAVAEALRASV